MLIRTGGEGEGEGGEENDAGKAERMNEEDGDATRDGEVGEGEEAATPPPQNGVSEPPAEGAPLLPPLLVPCCSVRVYIFWALLWDGDLFHVPGMACVDFNN